MPYHKDYNGINLCVKCYPAYVNMCKPKVIDHRKDFEDEPEYEKPLKKTFKKNR